MPSGEGGKVNIGDLVTGVDYFVIDGGASTGIVIEILHNVEIPPLIAVLWDNGHITKTYQDELQILCKSDLNVVE